MFNCNQSNPKCYSQQARVTIQNYTPKKDEFQKYLTLK